MLGHGARIAGRICRRRPVCGAAALAWLVCQFLLLLSPAGWTRETQAARADGLRSTVPAPPCSDSAWRADDVAGWLKPALRRAEVLAKTEPVPWDEQAYREFSVNGQRDAGQRMIWRRQEPLTSLVLVECQEGQGRFLPALERTLDALASQPSWTLPAHDPDLGNLRGEYSVDLNACETAHDLAWALRLLGDRLAPATRKRVDDALEARIFAPLRRTVDARARGAALGPHWWLEGDNNWNAVCLSGVVGAAYVLARADLDDWVGLGASSIRHYLDGLRADGYSDEGPSYWNYGFGQFLRLRETLLEATGGSVDLMRDEKAQAMAGYPRRIDMGGGSAPLFGDAPPGTRIDPVRRAHAEVAIGWSRTEAWAALARPTSSGGRLNEAIWRLWGRPAAAVSLPPIGSSACTLFPVSGVVVFRPPQEQATADDIAFGIRIGGSKSHAHDDAGSYVVTVAGETVTGDPGAPTYTKETFGPQRRRSPLVNSLGHPVPRVDGRLQLDATRHEARWKRRPCAAGGGPSEVEVAEIDLTGVYDVAGLTALTRRVEYRDGRGATVVVADSFAANRELDFETALIARGEVEVVGDTLIVRQPGRTIEAELSASGPFSVVSERIEDDPKNRFVRVALRLDDRRREGCVAYRIRVVGANSLPLWESP